MLKFLRKFRQQLLVAGKFQSYLIYALGEIILVVIGILLALQINTWNQERIARVEEKIILTNIITEFEQNQKELRGAITMNEQCIATGRYIMSLIGQPEAEIRKINMDSLLFQGFEYSQFNTSENALNDLLMSGRLQRITDNDIKLRLYQWSRVVKGVEDQFEGVDDKVENELVPYLTKNYPMKNVDSYGRLGWKKMSTLKVDKLKIFQDIEYENIMDDYLYRLTGYVQILQQLDAVISATMKESKAYQE